MSMEQIVTWVGTNAPMMVQLILMGLGALVVTGQCYVAFTPRKDDDAFVAKLEKKPIIGNVLRFFKAFSPIQPKNDKQV